MIVSEVRWDQIEKASRIDAEYFRPKYLSIEDELNRLSLRLQMVPLGELVKKIKTSAFYGSLALNYRKYGMPFLRVSDIKNLTVELQNLVYLSDQDIVKYSKSISELRKGDVVITKGGTLGNIGVIPDELERCLICRDLIGIVLKDTINPYYLAIFLETKLGKLQLVRGRSQQVQPHLTLPEIRKIKIIVPPPSFQQRIESLVKQAYQKRNQADAKYKEAESLLNKMLGIEQLNLRQDKTFEVGFDEVKPILRFDAEYFLPKYTKILKLLKTSGYEVKRLREISKEVVRKINPTQRPAEKFTYIEIGDVDISTGAIETKNILGYEAPPNARKLLKKGDLIISMVRPTRGAITIIPEELDNSIGSIAFYVLNPESPLKEFLFLYLRSPLGLNQLGRPVVGAMYPTLKKHDVDNIIIPLIPTEAQKEISLLIKESFILRKEAKGLLEKAKEEVEQYIEKGGSQNRNFPAILIEGI